ncbi:MAG TPA: M20 family metallopeptidase [Nitrolancea sp.]|nr:M20 family metallopeptidase [Nitrolancea sp.]
MNDLERSLTEAIQRRESNWIDLWRDLVNCDSGTYNKDEADRAGDILAKTISDLGFATERVPQKQFGDHVVARKPGNGTKRLLFIGHFDTVFPRGTVKERPFTIKGDRATGPGVSDMKGGLAVMIAALSALKETGAPLWDDVSLTTIFNSDEEILSPTSRPVIEAEAQHADTVCVLEPARPGGEYTFVRKGAGMFKFSVTGRAAHSGGAPQQGRSAVEELAQKIIRLHQITDFNIGTTVNVGVIEGGIRPNVVAEHAECQFDMRVLTHAEADRVQQRFKEIAAMQFVPDTTTEFSGSLFFPPLEYRKRNELLFNWVQDSARKLGLEMKSIVSGGGSDGNTAGQFAPLIDGMGVEGDGAHSNREVATVSSLVRRASVLALFLNTWYERADQIGSVED